MDYSKLDDAALAAETERLRGEHNELRRLAQEKRAELLAAIAEGDRRATLTSARGKLSTLTPEEREAVTQATGR